MDQGKDAFSKIAALTHQIEAIDLNQLDLRDGLGSAQEALDLCTEFINLYNHLESRGKNELNDFLMGKVLSVLRALGFFMTIDANGTVYANPDRTHPYHATPVNAEDLNDDDALNDDSFDYDNGAAAFALDELPLVSDEQNKYDAEFRKAAEELNATSGTSGPYSVAVPASTGNADDDCEHGVKRTECLTCTGVQYCRHNIPKIQCDFCMTKYTWPQYCQHDKYRSTCVLCDGPSICKHGRVKYRCKECGGLGICPHGTQKSRCKACRGVHLCEHGKEKNKCRQCFAEGKPVSSFCEHGISKYTCRIHGRRYYCEHDNLKTRCKICRSSCFCTHGRLKIRCEECKKNKSEGGGRSKTRKSKKVVGHKKTKRFLRKSSRKSSRKLHIY